MTPVITKSEMVKGEYYLCYEIFDSREKNIFIGTCKDDHLLGTVFTFHAATAGVCLWRIYSNFIGERGHKQWVFKMTDMEIYKHVMLEDI